MRKIAIVTKYSAYNYGAMLQAYALQRTISKHGGEPFFVDCGRQQRPKIANVRDLNSLLNKVYSKLYAKDLDLCYSRFEEFRTQMLPLSAAYQSYDELLSNPPEADIYLSGSDQVWNPLRMNPINYLTFAPKDKIKASYAASMGVSYLPEGNKRLFKEYVSKFDYISVREEDAKDIVDNMTSRECRTDVDPVFLLSNDEWRSIASIPEKKRSYILCYLIYRPDWINRWLRELHHVTKKDIVVVTTNPYRNIYHNRMVRNCGPKEMLGLLLDADFVISSSFHGVALSIANNKPFYAVVNPEAPARISNMLRRFDMEKRIINEKSPIELSDIDFKSHEALVAKSVRNSIDYLSTLINCAQKCADYSHETIEQKKHGSIDCVGSKCAGCKVCSTVCPVHAIQYKKDQFGFDYPVVDKSLCINCGRCAKSCQVCCEYENSYERCKLYYGWNLDETVREKSSSGGFFSVLADYTLKKNGVVFGAYFDKDTKSVKHGSSDKIDWELFRRSKYVESDILPVIPDIKEALSNGRLVLFCGTPCQCNGLRLLFGDDSNLILCDFFCHGVPSGKLFSDFLSSLEASHHAKITSFQFRTKKFGWDQHGLSASFDNGKEEDCVGRCEPYFVATMIDNLFLRECCYTCDRSMYHLSDFTIGDYWGIAKNQKHDNKGISAIIVNTELGNSILSVLKSALELKTLKKSDINYAFNTKNKECMIKTRNNSFEEYLAKGYDAYMVTHYRLRMLKNTFFFIIRNSLKKL